MGQDRDRREEEVVGRSEGQNEERDMPPGGERQGDKKREIERGR